MDDALKKYVIAPLLSIGFTGKYPHYRRVSENRIELLVIQKNKWGNSFTVEISTIYPQREGNKKNYDEEATIDDVNVWNTNLRYRLPGMFDGWFYYTDVYVKHIPFFGKNYIAVSEKEKQDFRPEKGYKQIQIADETIYESVCREVNKQMEKAFIWWKKMSTF